MTSVSWNDVDPRPEGSGNNGRQGGGKGKFLQLKPGEYKLRPVGKPKEIRRYFVDQPDGTKKIAITGEKEDNCVIMRKYRNAEGEPLYPQRTRYAFNCFDRADGHLKIVEVSSTVARAIRNWSIENNINPGSGKGIDFKIKVQKTGPQPRDIKYEVIACIQTPFSDAERDLLEKQGVYDLDETFKVIDQNEIENHLGLTEGKPVAAAASTATRSDDSDDFAPRTSANKGQAATAPKAPAGRTSPVDEDIAF